MDVSVFDIATRSERAGTRTIDTARAATGIRFPDTSKYMTTDKEQ